jgi:hypothetical protein
MATSRKRMQQQQKGAVPLLKPESKAHMSVAQHQLIDRERTQRRFQPDSDATPRNPLNKIESTLAGSASHGLWTCAQCGVSWSGATHRQRKREGTRCPACSGATLTRSNGLATMRPDVIENLTTLERNAPWKYDRETLQSFRSLRFHCDTCQREYEMSIRQRCAIPAGQGNGCPHCNKTKVALAMEALEDRVRNAAPERRLDGRTSDMSVIGSRERQRRGVPLNYQPLVQKRLHGPN